MHRACEEAGVTVEAERRRDDGIWRHFKIMPQSHRELLQTVLQGMTYQT